MEASLLLRGLARTRRRWFSSKRPAVFSSPSKPSALMRAVVVAAPDSPALSSSSSPPFFPQSEAGEERERSGRRKEEGEGGKKKKETEELGPRDGERGEEKKKRGPQLRLEVAERPIAEEEKEILLLRVKAAGVNRLDLLQKVGKRGDRPTRHIHFFFFSSFSSLCVSLPFLLPFFSMDLDFRFLSRTRRGRRREQSRLRKPTTRKERRVVLLCKWGRQRSLLHIRLCLFFLFLLRDGRCFVSDSFNAPVRFGLDSPSGTDLVVDGESHTRSLSACDVSPRDSR